MNLHVIALVTRLEVRLGAVALASMLSLTLAACGGDGAAGAGPGGPGGGPPMAMGVEAVTLDARSRSSGPPSTSPP